MVDRINGLTLDRLQTREKQQLLPLAPNDYRLIFSSYPPEVRTVVDNLSSNESNRFSLSSPAGLWAAILGALEVRVARPTFDTFLRDTQGAMLENDHLTVWAGSPFIVEYCEKRLINTVREAASVVARRSIAVTFVVQPSSRSKNSDPPRAARASSMPDRGNNRYTFSAFIVGPHNDLAHSAAVEAVKAPGGKFSPLLLCAAPGLGKTHLLQSIYAELSQTGLNAALITSDQFIAEFVDAIFSRTTKEFRKKYHSLDALLIDDIQFLRGKSRTQDSLYHIFNDLHQRGCQIVLASDQGPTDLGYLEPRLRSRFTSGLTVSLLAPNQEARLDFLARKTGQLPIPEDVLVALSRPACASVRDLEGRLNRLLARVELTARTPSLSLAATVLAEEALVSPITINMSPEEVLSRVAQYFGIPPATLSGPSRQQTTTRARHCAIWLLRSLCALSLSEIGRLLGGRDHSTIRQALQKMEDEEQKTGALTSIKLQLVSLEKAPAEPQA